MQFGFVAIYLSESFIRGFMTAAGLQILISVLKYVFGLTVPSYTGPLAIVYVSGCSGQGAPLHLLTPAATAASLRGLGETGRVEGDRLSAALPAQHVWVAASVFTALSEPSSATF